MMRQLNIYACPCYVTRATAILRVRKSCETFTNITLYLGLTLTLTSRIASADYDGYFEGWHYRDTPFAYIDTP